MKKCLRLGLSCFFALMTYHATADDQTGQGLPDANHWQQASLSELKPQTSTGKLFLALLPNENRFNVIRGQGHPNNLQIRSDQLWGINSWLSGMAGVGYTSSQQQTPYLGLPLEQESYGNWRLGLFAELAGFDLELSYQHATIEPQTQDKNQLAFTISRPFSF